MIHDHHHSLDHVHVNHKEFIVDSTPGAFSDVRRQLFDGDANHYWNKISGRAGYQTRSPGSGNGVTLIVDTLKERYLRYTKKSVGFFLRQCQKWVSL